MSLSKSFFPVEKFVRKNNRIDLKANPVPFLFSKIDSSLPHPSTVRAVPMMISNSALTKIDGRHDAHEMLLRLAFLTYGLFSVKLLSKREKINKWIELFIKNSPRNKIQMMKVLKKKIK